jgi:hypothetical protein
MLKILMISNILYVKFSTSLFVTLQLFNILHLLSKKCFIAFSSKNPSFLTGKHASKSNTVDMKTSPNYTVRSSSYRTVNTINLRYNTTRNVRINVILRRVHVTVFVVERK